MRWYKEFSPELRKKSMLLFTKARKTGLIKEPGKCCKCGITKETGAKRMDWHNEDYNETLRILEDYYLSNKKFDIPGLMKCVYPICSKCHMHAHIKWMKKIDYFNNPKYKDE